MPHRKIILQLKPCQRVVPPDSHVAVEARRTVKGIQLSDAAEMHATLQRCLAACLKLLINLPRLLDFLRGLLEGAGNSLVGGSGVLVFFAPDHLIQLTLCPRFMVRIAEGMVNSCRSSRGPCTTVGDGRNDEAPGWGRTEPSESESGVEEGVITGPRSVFAAMGVGTLGWGSRSTRASGRRSWSVPGPNITTYISRRRQLRRVPGRGCVQGPSPSARWCARPV